MTRNAGRNKDSLEKLLAWLEPDRELAALKYLKIEARLIKWFMCNDCADDAEGLAEKAIDRVMRKVSAREVPEPYVGDKATYFLGFAPNLQHEHFRKRRPREIPPPVVPPNDIEDEDTCLEECMRKLEREDHRLAIEYYRFEKAEKIKHRRRLADQIGLGLAGLRTRMHRIREELKPCIEKCLDRLQSH